MATRKIDLFYDDLMDVMRKHGIDDPRDKLGNAKLADAFDGLVTEVEGVFEAAEKLPPCDHCGGRVTRLYPIADLKGGQLAVCSQCHDGISLDLDEINDPRNAPESEASFLRWANPGIGKW